MRGNSHVQFLGRSDPATGRSYPTRQSIARPAVAPRRNTSYGTAHGPITVAYRC
jgi:hypothetical protein